VKRGAKMNKALFIDRDGVINIDKGHVFLKEDFEFSPGIFVLCRKYSDAGFLIIVITNQAGIAKGIYTEKDFLKLTEWMTGEFKKNGIIISKVYFCPHHPDITGSCDCRKPKPGMILKAKEEFDLDLSESVLIGDMENDLQAGRNAGIPEKNLHSIDPPPP
jgi:histidinol-phosphate phosphatase family domain/HAD-superfamily hydrolase, subfamily IIIA